MAFCSKCGAQLAEGAKFCPSCGAKVGEASAVPQSTGDKVGTIRKCPACGAEIPGMAAVCPQCGHEISDVKANSSVKAFFEKISAIDDEAYAREASMEAKAGEGGIGKQIASMYLSPMKSLMKLGPDAAEKRKIALIEAYPIPNSKEDILEFLILASSCIKKATPLDFLGNPALLRGNPVNKAWIAKCNQAYSKAKIGFGSDKEAMQRVEEVMSSVKGLKK